MESDIVSGYPSKSKMALAVFMLWYKGRARPSEAQQTDSLTFLSLTIGTTFSPIGMRLPLTSLGRAAALAVSVISQAHGAHTAV